MVKKIKYTFGILPNGNEYCSEEEVDDDSPPSPKPPPRRRPAQPRPEKQWLSWKRRQRDREIAIRDGLPLPRSLDEDDDYVRMDEEKKAKAQLKKMKGRKRKAEEPTTTLTLREQPPKRSKSPERPKLFAGVSFYYIPCYDLEDRRKGIMEAIARCGGRYIGENDSKEITHVVVDKSVILPLVIARFPDAIIVDDAWFMGCFEAHKLIEPFAIGYTPAELEAFRKKTLEEAAEVRARGEQELKGKIQQESQRIQLVEEQKDKEEKVKMIEKEKEIEDIEEQRKDARLFFTKSRPFDDDYVLPPTRDKPSPANEFEQAIEDTYKHLHLPDIDDVEDEIPDTTAARASSQESERYLSPRGPPKKGRKILYPQSQPACMVGSDGSVKGGNPNAKTIEVLEEVMKWHVRNRQQFRELAYRKAIGTLRNRKTKICTYEEALALPNIGQRLATKIQEIVSTSRLSLLDNVLVEPSDQALQKFLGIYGVGCSKATEWAERGFRTLEDLLNHAHLTPNQRVGIEHYDDFNSRIPRAEVTAHGDFVKKIAHEIDPDLSLEIMGSYRRGAATCGDIDIMITKNGSDIGELRSIVVRRLVPALFKAAFLKVGLAAATADQGRKWHGASCIPGSSTWRRIDLLLVPIAELGAATLYFTGNDIFNRSMRLIARKKGFSLSEKGLFSYVMRDKAGIKMTEGFLVEARYEERIFDILGIPFRPPEERNP
ncbi:MAG: hypothetical protein M1829_000166 [Trizodia sp. TS-e1964]|nr:MAG: hypothetical protein M1829_000166 [Trizodia sp. TS-e1964]